MKISSAKLVFLYQYVPTRWSKFPKAFIRMGLRGQTAKEMSARVVR